MAQMRHTGIRVKKPIAANNFFMSQLSKSAVVTANAGIDRVVITIDAVNNLLIPLMLYISPYYEI